MRLAQSADFLCMLRCGLSRPLFRCRDLGLPVAHDITQATVTRSGFASHGYISKPAFQLLAQSGLALAVLLSRRQALLHFMQLGLSCCCLRLGL
jgi:hypothetical protein